MVQVYVHYDALNVKTMIKVNGRDLKDDNPIMKEVKKQRLYRWVDTFPQLLVKTLKETEFEITFCGSQLDWDDFEYAFMNAKNKGMIQKMTLTFIRKEVGGIDLETVSFLHKLSEEPCQNKFDQDLQQKIEQMKHLEFTVLAVSDTESGKSTLMNALLGKKLLTSKKGGCSTVVTEIRNNGNKRFRASAYNEQGVVAKEIDNPNYEIMMELNHGRNIQKITIEGAVPFWTDKDVALTLTDMPNAKEIKRQEYYKIIDRATSGEGNYLILYVLDGNRICDNMPVLKHIAGRMKKGGARVCSQVLFVVNKLDMLNPEEDDTQEVIRSAKECLVSYGIENPQIIPCSAFLAMGIKNYFRQREMKNLNNAQKKRLRWVARETLHLLDKMTEHKNMQLHQYAMLQSDVQKQISKHLLEAKKKKDIKTQGLICSGICSVEAAIVEHMRYYVQKKQKELLDMFDEYNWRFIETNPCKILVTATMSAGKSTFINALTGESVCLSQSLACTDKVYPIISKPIDTEVDFGYDGALKEGLDNEKKKAAKIVYFNSELGGQRMVVYDSPGVNYSEDSKHKKITDKIIRTGDHQLLIYLMNATQLGTNDDEKHLEYVRKYIGGKTVLFVINKVDAFNEEEEEVEAIVLKQVAYLKSKGFQNPLVCPVSAKAGFLAKKSQKEALSRLERRELNCMEDKFAQMKLADYYHKYYPSIKIEDSENEDRQLLKTCGMSYIETIIKTFFKGGSVNGTSIC